MRRAGGFCTALALSACASQMAWEKPGASQNEFAQDRYVCMQQSQQPSSSAFVNAYGGAASSGVITNGNLFNACMNSRGWSLRQQASAEAIAAKNQQIKSTVDAFTEELRQLCARE